MFFLYGESLIYYFKHIVIVDEYFLYFAIHHRFISSVLYLIGICSLGPGLMYRLCVLCHDVETGIVYVPVYAVLLDSYDAFARCLSSAFHRQLDL